jgi:hypothetical protein
MNIFRSWTFTWWEVGVLKVCLISLGILLAQYFGAYVLDLTKLWWVLFLGPALYFIIRFFSESK